MARMEPMFQGLYPPAPVKWYLPLSQSAKENPLGAGNTVASQGFGATPWHSGQGEKKNEQEQFLNVFIQHAKELLPMDNGGLHTFCVTAYYPGEAKDVVESRKSTIVSGCRSSIGWDYEDCHFLKSIKVPYNPRQQLLMVDIFEKDIDIPWYPDELIGRTTIQLADDRCRRMASYDVVRGHDLEGTVTLRINFPDAEEVRVGVFEDEDVDKMPRGLARSKETNAPDIKGFGTMEIFDQPRQMAGFKEGPGSHKPRSSSNSTESRSAEGSPQKDLWVQLDPPCGLNLDAPVQSILNFKGRGLPDGSMSPLPTFGPEWFRIPASNPLSRHMPPPLAFPRPVPTTPCVLAPMAPMASIARMAPMAWCPPRTGPLAPQAPLPPATPMMAPRVVTVSPVKVPPPTFVSGAVPAPPVYGIPVITRTVRYAGA